VQQSNAWEVSAFYEHYWNPNWRTSLFGNYSRVSYGDAGNALLAASFAPGGATRGAAATGLTQTGGNFDLGLAQIGTKTAWTPVKNLTLSAEFIYSRIDQNLQGTYTGAATGKASQVYNLSNQNAYNGAVQVLRSF
jgi:hypothetical protein